MRKCAITIIALAHEIVQHQLITYLAPPQSASIFPHNFRRNAAAHWIIRVQIINKKTETETYARKLVRGKCIARNLFWATLCAMFVVALVSDRRLELQPVRPSRVSHQAARLAPKTHTTSRRTAFRGLFWHLMWGGNFIRRCGGGVGDVCLVLA